VWISIWQAWTIYIESLVVINGGKIYCLPSMNILYMVGNCVCFPTSRCLMEECMMLVRAGIAVVGRCSGVVLLGGVGTRNGGLEVAGDCSLCCWWCGLF
jgi:hypothetical protein